MASTENETNQRRLYDGPSATPYVKDGIDDAVVGGRADAVNPVETGTKVSAHYVFDVPAGHSVSVRLRLGAVDPPREPSERASSACSPIASPRRTPSMTAGSPPATRRTAAV